MNEQVQTGEEAAMYNPFLPEMRADPYPFYRRLRQRDPIHRTILGVWVLTRYQDCVQVLRDPRFSVNHRNNSTGMSEMVAELTTSAADRGMDNVMLFIDPPDHTRLRTLVNKAFTPRAVAAMRDRIQTIADELLNEVEQRGEMDVIAEFAYRLPVTVIADMLGIPDEDRSKFRTWSREVAPILDPVVSPEDFNRAALAGAALGMYFEELVQHRRRDPGDDLLSHLIPAEEEGDKLSVDELRSTCVLLLVAGHETTMNLIGNGLYALLRHPDQLARLRSEPGFVRSAVEELLRYDSPVHLTARTALDDVALDGVTVHKGELCLVLIAAANRDPAQFTDPDTLDIAREDNKHIAFSAGPHFCVGATLARLEGQIALDTLLRKFPSLALAEEPEYRETITLRGLKELRVRF